jgi:polar amino acid transport system substrate-binding protein
VSGRLARRLVAVLLTGGVLAACSSKDNGGVVGGTARTGGPLAPAGQFHRLLPPAVASAGVLRVSGDVSRAPLLFYGTGTRQPEGFEWELLQDLGRQLGVSVTVTDTPLVRMVPALRSGKADLIASAFVDLRAVQAQGVDFVDYLQGRTAALVREGNPDRISGPGDLCGRAVGVQFDTAQEVAEADLDATCKAAHRPGITVRLAADHRALIDLLTGGRVAADLDDAVVASYTAETSTGPSTVQVVGDAVDPMPYGIGVRHDDPRLLAAVQAALRAVVSDGEYDSALARWGGEIEALRTTSVNGGR